MLRFSQRIGRRPLAKALQREGMDDDLRNRIWNVLTLLAWDVVSAAKNPGISDIQHYTREVNTLLARMWAELFVLPLDRMPDLRYKRDDAVAFVRDRFFEADWAEVYDMVEFVIANLVWGTLVAEAINEALEAENAAYRVVGTQVVSITDETEIEAVQSALDHGTKSSKAHFARSIELLSDREEPDYPNATKESISGVEAVAQVVCNKPDATLGACLGPLKDMGCLHQDFKAVLERLYGYACNEGGIRHARKDGSADPSFADAKFMLVVCSAYANYIITRAAELGIRIA